MGILQKQIAIVEEFSAMTDWEDRYKRIITIGRELPALPAEMQTDDAKVRGCSSSVWLHATIDNGTMHYQADSDALIVRGLVALLIQVYNDEPAADVIKHDPMFIAEIGLDQHLTANRANGLGAMVKQIKAYAVALSA